jgi:small subunit ribosomal protein S14
MANKAAVAKNRKQKMKLASKSTHFHEIKFRNRCELCGRPRGYIGRFKICRICFRKRALNAELPGVRKASW